jgi:hypothetical protein
MVDPPWAQSSLADDKPVALVAEQIAGRNPDV